MKKVSKVAVKFSGIVSIIILIIMPTMASLILNQTKDYFIKEMQIRAEFFARDVRESLFPKTDTFKLYFAVREIAKEKAILNAMVLDDKGVILSHSDKSKIGGKIHGVINRTLVVEEKGFYEINVPITVGEERQRDGAERREEERGGKNIGAVRVGFSQQSVMAALSKMRNKIILITIGVLFVSILATIIAVTIMVKPINIMATAARRIGDGDLDQKIVIRRNDELGELGRTFNEMIKGLKDRDFIRDTFGRYVSKPVAKAILNGRLKLGGERKRATVLFSDIRDSTSLSEELPPEDVVEFLNEYFAEMVSVIIKYEGTVDKFIGDEILAVFGTPISHSDDAKRAVFAAIEMQQKLKIFNAKRKMNGKEEISIGIGVNTGELVAGNIGSEVRMEYTVIGDTVNLTSRIEALNKQFGTQILIGEDTYKEVSEVIVARELPSFEVKGREKKIKVYEVLSRK
ncbi:MAG: adenylate/guanylate cyclase domain-containing protein [Elusimicrobiota bacterium]